MQAIGLPTSSRKSRRPRHWSASEARQNIRTNSIMTPTSFAGLCSAAQAALLVLGLSTPATAQPAEPDTRPLSPAQLALFETPHLSNVEKPETLLYTIARTGVAPYNDTIAVHVKSLNTDGTKDLCFDYQTGEHHVRFPELDNFQGNPLLMLTLDQDVAQMHDAVGLSRSYFRNRIRESFVAAATIAPASFTLAGAPVSAQAITVQPFKAEDRLSRVPSLQQKTYTFVLAPAVPGMIAEIRIDTPHDSSMNIPEIEQRTRFDKVQP